MSSIKSFNISEMLYYVQLNKRGKFVILELCIINIYGKYCLICFKPVKIKNIANLLNKKFATKLIQFNRNLSNSFKILDELSLNNKNFNSGLTKYII